MVTKVIPFNPGAGAAAGGAALGAQVFGWVLLGLGLIVTTVQAIELMNAYTEFSGELETSIYYYPDGSWSYGVDMTFVERVRAFLFDTGVLSDPVLVLSELDRSAYNAALSDYALNGFDSCHVILAINNSATSSGYNKVSFGQYAPVLENGRYAAYNASGQRAYFVTYTLQGSKYVKTTGTTPWPGVETYIFRSGCAVSNDASIEVGQVAIPEVPLPIGYPEWHTNARPATNPDTQEEITVLPIPLNPSADPDAAPDTLTQPDIWQGSLADPMPDTDTNPDTGTDTDPDTQPDSPGAPSSDIGDYQIDLKKFFPFCIPFDLYDFFTCLNADPVAPVIEWVIPLPGGDTYPLVIDLSAFDSVAQLLRRLQLLLFCVGLAFKTRDLIKG